jgi:hypothetical protein
MYGKEETIREFICSVKNAAENARGDELLKDPA